MERWTRSSKPSRSRRLHRVLGGSELHLVPEVGHMLTYADSTAMAQAVEYLETPLVNQDRRLWAPISSYCLFMYAART